MTNLTYTARGIILRETNIGESNKILTLLIKDIGKLSCTARGCRNHKSKLFSCSGIFCYGDFVINTTGKYPLLEQAVPIESFYNIRTDLDTLAYATYFMEIMDRTTPDGIESNESMLLLLKALQKLNNHKNPLHICCIFKIKLLQIYGYIPELESCGICRVPTDIFTAEGLVCQGCLPPNTQYIKISAAAIEAIKYIICNDIKNIFSIIIEDDLLKELSLVSDFLFNHHIDLQFKSYKFIKKLNEYTI